MDFEYKAVGGPERGKRRKGCKTAADRVAAAMQDIIRSEAADGWEYLRTDLVPIEERNGIFARKQVMHCAVLVFRRLRRPVEGQLGKGQLGKERAGEGRGGMGPGLSARQRSVFAGAQDTPEAAEPRRQETRVQRPAPAETAPPGSPYAEPAPAPAPAPPAPAFGQAQSQPPAMPRSYPPQTPPTPQPPAYPAAEPARPPQPQPQAQPVAEGTRIAPAPTPEQLHAAMMAVHPYYMGQGVPGAPAAQPAQPSAPAPAPAPAASPPPAPTPEPAPKRDQPSGLFTRMRSSDSTGGQKGAR